MIRTADCAPVALLADGGGRASPTPAGGASWPAWSSGPSRRCGALGAGPITARIGPCIAPAATSSAPTSSTAVAAATATACGHAPRDGRPALDLAAGVAAALERSGVALDGRLPPPCTATRADALLQPPGPGRARPAGQLRVARAVTVDGSGSPRCTTRIEAAGGDPDAIVVVAVTKGFDAAAVDAARGRRAGRPRRELRPGAGGQGRRRARAGVRWHFIGRLQRNKVRSLAAARRPVAERRPARARRRDRPAGARGRGARPGERVRRADQGRLRARRRARARCATSRAEGLDVAGPDGGRRDRAARGGPPRLRAAARPGRPARAAGAVDGHDRRPRGGGGRGGDDGPGRHRPVRATQSRGRATH